MNNSRPRIALRGFKLGTSGTGHVLGELETAIMNVFWKEHSLTVTDVEDKLRESRQIAHTTVLTTLDRMHRKGYLVRQKEGKAFVYSARYSKEEFEKGMAQEILGALLDHYTAPALSAFIDLVGQDEGTLDQLEAMIHEKREKGRPRK